MAKRVSQVVIEVLYTGTPKQRVSQVVVEALYKVHTGAEPQFKVQVIG